MKRIRRNISPLFLIAIGAWMVLNQNASMTVLGIAALVLSTLGITLSVTDKESTKTSKGLHVGLNGVLAAAGAWMLISHLTLTKYLKYILGGIVVIYALLTLRRMFRFKYRMGFKIAEAVPVALGAGLMLIPLGEDIFTPAAGGVMALTGVVTLAGNLFGKKKKNGEPAGSGNEKQKGAEQG